jgi:hypothetical protein
MFVWSLILSAYIVYRRKRPQLHQASKYKMPGGVAMCYACLAFFAFVLVLLSLQPDTREALLATPAWFVLLALGYAWKGRRGSSGRRCLRAAPEEQHAAHHEERCSEKVHRRIPDFIESVDPLVLGTRITVVGVKDLHRALSCTVYCSQPLYG